MNIGGQNICHSLKASQPLAERGNVSGCRATATTNDAGAATRERDIRLREGRRGKIVNETATFVAGETGIGIDGQGKLGQREIFHQAKRRFRAVHAIDADDLGVMIDQPRKGLVQGQAARKPSLLIGGQRADGRAMMKRLLYVESEDEFVEILEGLEEYEIRAAFEQSPHLGAKTLLTIDARSFRLGLRNAERPHAARDVSFSPSALSGELGGLPVELVDAIRKPMTRQANGVCPEGIRFDDAGARGHVFGVDLADQLRARKAKRFQALVRSDAALKEKRANGAVAAKRTILQLLEETHEVVGARSLDRCARILLRASSK